MLKLNLVALNTLRVLVSDFNTESTSIEIRGLNRA
eukprot:SAG31_NODE_11923_length_985_cov_3.336343_2_plen_34_part_01